MSCEIAIEVENLSKCYQIYDQPRDRLKQFIIPRIQKIFGMRPKNYSKEFWALKNISFKLNKGSSLGILGLNGAGKSTLLQVICGTLTPSSGRVKINGRVSALLELGTGFNTEFTGLENIYLNGSIFGLSKQQIDNRLGDILEFADIGDFVHQPVKTYSSGMYVRLAFAIAIHADPDILVIDEALAVGDFIFQQKCNLFLKNNLSGVTKIFVSHDTSAIANLTDTCLVLSRGQLIFFGESQAAIQEYQIASREKNARRNLPADQEIVEFPRELANLPASDSTLEIDGTFWMDVLASSLSGSLEATVIKYTWCVNGEWQFNIVKSGDHLEFLFQIDCRNEVRSPIIGYQVQDRFGVVVFGQNTIDSSIDVAPILSGKSTVKLRFQWPEISNGKYSITLGIGSGAHGEAHHILCWAHNIVTFDSVSARPVHGIFNNQIVELTVKKNEKTE